MEIMNCHINSYHTYHSILYSSAPLNCVCYLLIYDSDETCLRSMWFYRVYQIKFVVHILVEAGSSLC